MDSLRKSNRCMEAVLSFLDRNAVRLRQELPEGAFLAVYIDGSQDEHVKLLQFASEELALRYKDEVLPEEFRDGAVVVPVSANVALML